MKIIHIVESFGGGVYSYFKDLAMFFSQHPDIETYIIYSNKRKEITQDQIDQDFPSSIHLIPLEMERELKPIQDLRSTFALRKTIKQLRPDIIHLHSSKAGVIGRWASSMPNYKRKVFYTPHGYSFLRQDISPVKQKIFYTIEKLTQLIFGGTTIACGDTEYKLAQRIGTSLLVRNGIDLTHLNQHYIANKNTSNQLTIGTIGRISYQKNPKLFNEVALLFPQHQFLWIGDGELRDQLTAPNITISGWFTNNTAVFPYLNQLDIYMQTSLWEGLPIAVLEAMAFRKPILATDVIGNNDIVETNLNGFLFTQATDLCPILKQLENPEYRIALGEKAFSNCQEKFNKDKNFNELLAIYQS
ncbi:glycosyltransferase involved in cell wall biosynthesis [Myroides gitamensis]|uniref:UDP-D-galactose:(Glucosyl)lipopolysaccharide-1,6-D-galactosyltransferase n=1 Tax=Myroides odoratus TaxID=256 RepID=A0A378U481_MYROD|nr:glycosyltransferase [Myroides odoratus]MCS4239283.1 glycosyltransferase involved in cell wall biosynthesis [Myroides odoratus]MDH6602336.1 glycosyltransferase involved in cell wall biosynthesis [Myroides gitamensis]QQU03473.1 glycosyltransferase [Myroides odoratus]STZ69260.1 UDP-D-galactose:(glucosyl)lipopolysaccharide-1,6-D-galactosyltransferase [Myroides odoratus]